jgi:hypothetical protein
MTILVGWPLQRAFACSSVYVGMTRDFLGIFRADAKRAACSLSFRCFFCARFSVSGTSSCPETPIGRRGFTMIGWPRCALRVQALARASLSSLSCARPVWPSFNEGANLYQVQKILGHTDGRMTQRYLKARPRRIAGPVAKAA